MTEQFDELPFSTAEADWPPPVEREPRPCRRHQWVTSTLTILLTDDEGNPLPSPSETRCARCGKLKDPTASRRGKNNRNRGNSIEREVAAKLGLRRVGQYGGLADAEAEWLVVQVKSGGAYPERIDKLLRSLTANANQLRAVVHADAPGAGHRRRALVTVDLDDFLAWFGGSGEGA